MSHLFALFCLCYVHMLQLVLHHVHDYYISCLNVTYLFPVFAHSDRDLWRSSIRYEIKYLISDLIFWYDILKWNWVLKLSSFWASVWQQMVRPCHFFAIFLDFNSSPIFMLWGWHYWPSSHESWIKGCHNFLYTCTAYNFLCYSLDFIHLYVSRMSESAVQLKWKQYIHLGFIAIGSSAILV